ncbi:hypothetical protein [Sphingomonas elodea]|uniref:hypothetical protein n=1 Tax=Sphingomonas elodea TaxID=179878 RepID=UPI000263058A|nr:hypothetical protein [Sphingomonas elodea]
MASLRFHTSPTSGRLSGRLVWLFVAALLFGAVAPLGPPDTLIDGAAFNPATTSVALAARRGDPHVVAALHRTGDGPRFDGATGHGAIVVPAAAVSLLFLPSARTSPAVLPMPRGSEYRTGLGARAPPRTWLGA